MPGVLTVPTQSLILHTDISKVTTEWKEEDVWVKRVGGEDYQKLETMQRAAASSFN